jgi:hypothetical protein
MSGRKPREPVAKCSIMIGTRECGHPVARACTNKCCLMHCDARTDSKCVFHDNYKAQKRLKDVKERATNVQKELMDILHKYNNPTPKRTFEFGSLDSFHFSFGPSIPEGGFSFGPESTHVPESGFSFPEITDTTLPRVLINGTPFGLTKVVCLINIETDRRTK